MWHASNHGSNFYYFYFKKELTLKWNDTKWDKFGIFETVEFIYFNIPDSKDIVSTTRQNRTKNKKVNK